MRIRWNVTVWRLQRVVDSSTASCVPSSPPRTTRRLDALDRPLEAPVAAGGELRELLRVGDASVEWIQRALAHSSCMVIQYS